MPNNRNPHLSLAVARLCSRCGLEILVHAGCNCRGCQDVLCGNCLSESVRNTKQKNVIYLTGYKMSALPQDKNEVRE